NQGYYIFAFNQPLPGQTVANPITVNSDFWTDYISLGPNQGSQFIRKERITPGDYTTDWNPTVFTFTTGTFSGKNIQIIVPFNTFVNSTDLYFNMITTDINGVPRDAIGFGLGTFSDSFNIDVNKLDTPQTITDPSNDVVLTPSPPEGFLPISTSYDIISGQIILQLQ
ncbi:MAG TPA: hypothetical protein PL110_16160, partial [Candidatus Eremiobacteraeota bacterium]|nr:hypothetical protein [Candidatus Eremiobacteraeota bacterium]